MALQRSLGFTQLCFYGVGTIVGAGIYSVIGAAAAEAGPAMWVSFLLAAIAAFLTALSYAELVGMHPKAGAEYQFLKQAFPAWPLLPFVAGFLIALNAAATSATVALAFGGYLKVFVEMPVALTAIALLTLCTALNIAGIRESTWVGIGLIVIEVAGLIAMIAGGVIAGEPSRVFQAGVGDGAADAAMGIFAATALLFFMYIGFEDIANLAEESKEPKRDIPRALMVAVAVTSVIYLAVAVAVLAVISPAELARSASPLTAAGAKVAPWLGQALAVTALFATASTALISLIAISRLLYGMARDGAAPAVLSKTLSKRKSPWVAALVLFAIAAALLPLGEVKTVASVSAFGVLIVFMGVQAAMIRLRFTQAGKARPFRVPLVIGKVPVPAVLGFLAAAALATQFEPVVYAIGLGTVALAIATHWVRSISVRRVRNAR